ncbi:MAG: DUF4352 domain-containing protein [Sarcina sp.]
MKKKLLIGLVIVIGLGIGLVACGSSDTSIDEGSKPAVTQEKKEYKVGDVVDIDGMKLKVDKVTTSGGNEFDKPKEGNEFVIVDLTITNDSKGNISYNPFDYSMKNSKGQITAQTFSTMNSDTALSSGELSQGGTVTGSIIFEAPKADAGLKLLYKGNILSDKVHAEINLN